MRVWMPLLLAASVIGGCVAPPTSEKQLQARQAAAAEYVARNCAAYLGGFSDVRELRQAANQRIATARGLGATDAEIQTARQEVETSMVTMAAFTSQQEACNFLIGELAWSMG